MDLNCFHFWLYELYVHIVPLYVYAMNITVQVFVWIYLFNSLGVELPGDMATLCWTCWGTTSPPHQLYNSTLPPAHYEASNFSTSPQHLLSVPLSTGIPEGMKWYLTVAPIRMSLITNAVKHLFIYLLATCISSLEKYLFKSFCYWWRCYCSSQDSVLRVMKNEADRHGATSKAFNEEWTSERKRTPGNWEGLQGKMPLRQQCWGTYKHKKEEVYIIGWGCF